MSRTYPPYAVGAAAAVLIINNKILLVKRKYPPGLGKWSVPGGVIEAGEKLIEAAKRELREETGLEADPIGILWVINNIVYDRNEKVLYHYLIIDILFDSGTIRGELRPGEDVLDVAWFSLNEVLNTPDVSRTVKSLVKRIMKHGLNVITVEEVDHIFRQL